MSQRSQTIENLETCYASIETLMDSLSADDWAVQSLCPDWDVKGVISHLAGVEHALAGWVPETGDSPPPFDRVGVFMGQAAEWSTDQLVAEAKQVFATRRADPHSVSQLLQVHRYQRRLQDSENWWWRGRPEEQLQLVDVDMAFEGGEEDPDDRHQHDEGGDQDQRQLHRVPKLLFLLSGHAPTPS